jgi:hypothetical protein
MIRDPIFHETPINYPQAAGMLGKYFPVPKSLS